MKETVRKIQIESGEVEFAQEEFAGIERGWLCFDYSWRYIDTDKMRVGSLWCENRAIFLEIINNWNQIDERRKYWSQK